MKNRSNLLLGIGLLMIGVILLLLNLVAPISGLVAWNLITALAGLGLLLAAFYWRVGGLAIPGAIMTTIGVMTVWLGVTERWGSWLYLWPLVLGSVGLGLVLANSLEIRNRRVQALGWGWMVLSLLFCGIYWALNLALPPALSWPLIILGLGLMFLLVIPICRLQPLAIPGTILTGLGTLLFWQNFTGNWESWAYAWGLIVTFVGLGLVLAGVRPVGLHMMLWSLLGTFVFALFLAPERQAIGRYWPAAMIVVGIVVLINSLRRKPAG